MGPRQGCTHLRVKNPSTLRVKKPLNPREKMGEMLGIRPFSVPSEVLPAGQGVQPGEAVGDRRRRPKPTAGEQGVEASPVELPVAWRAGVDMDEMRGRVPADAATFHAARRVAGVGEPLVER